MRIKLMVVMTKKVNSIRMIRFNTYLAILMYSLSFDMRLYAESGRR